MERLRPLNDFIFKKLFGEPESKENLRAFLNAILYNNIGNIKDIEIIKDKELTTDEITNKTGIIDVLAKIDDGTHINIEVQLTDQKNMDRRTLFYWSRIYNRGIIKGKRTLYNVTLSKILCKWKQDSVISFSLYLDSVFKYKHKLVHNQSPV